LIFSVNFSGDNQNNQKMPKGHAKLITSHIVDWDMCPLCGYTLKHFKDLKVQKKLVRLHMTKEHGVTDFVETPHNNHAFYPDKNQTVGTIIEKVRKDNQPQFI
jgi:hypothetical protein